MGGFDRNRFVPNNATFFLSPYEIPVVPLNTITVTAAPFSRSGLPAQLSSPNTLLTPGIGNSFCIDSSTPYLWLPEAACDAFSKVLGLTYDETLQLYTYGNNTSTRQNLIDWNLTFTFNIADSPGSANSIDITLPFEAFDHKLFLPFPGLNTTFNQTSLHYFPLRKAANNTQYTLGRVFLQEAYLTVDYERGNFSVFQAQFSMEGIQITNLVGITPPPNSNFTNPFVDPRRQSLSTAAWVGIEVGSAIGGILAFAAAVLLIWRWRRGRSFDQLCLRIKGKNRNLTKRSSIWCREKSTLAELQGTEFIFSEMPDSTKHELPANSPVELPACEVTFYRPPEYDNDTLRSGTQDLSLTSTSEKGRSPVSPVHTEESNISISPQTNLLLSPIAVNYLPRLVASEQRDGNANEARQNAERTNSPSEIPHIPPARRKYSWES
jgi:hypothetical protein